MPLIEFEYTIWFLPISLLLACAVAYVLYSKKRPWSLRLNRFLFVLRVALLTALFTLLLNPLINQFTEQIDKPKVVLAVDNSKSILNSYDSLDLVSLGENIERLESTLQSKGYEVFKKSLTSDWQVWEGLDFNIETSDLSSIFREIDADYENMNLKSVYLISDGKYNLGVSPLYKPHFYEINTVGLGDTIQRADVEIKSVLHNKIAYQGNKFPVLMEISAYGLYGKRTKARVVYNGREIHSESVLFESDQEFLSINFEIEAQKEGYQRYDLVLDSIDVEATVENNRRSIYIDVIDGKQSVLILSPRPHPDLKTLKLVIEENQNYEVEIFIPGIKKFPEGSFDLAISHNSFERTRLMDPHLKRLKDQNVPFFHVLGSKTDYDKVSTQVIGFRVKQLRNQRDQVTGMLNPDSEIFSISSDLNEKWSQLSPVSVPYGDVAIPTNAKSLLHQRVGVTETKKPLLLTYEKGITRNALLLADGIWQWRLQEFGLYENTDSFDEFFSKLIQYLSTKADKRKFRFYPVSGEFNNNESIQFRSELYNEVYDRIYGVPVKVEITSSNGSLVKQYSFVSSSQYSKLEINDLVPDRYDYSANLTFNGKTYETKGSFVVKEFQLEQIDQVADFNLLRQLALQNEGEFFTQEEFFAFDPSLVKSDFKSKIYFEENIYSAINLWWIMCLILILSAMEWGIRKYQGGY